MTNLPDVHCADDDHCVSAQVCRSRGDHDFQPIRWLTSVAVLLALLKGLAQEEQEPFASEDQKR